MGGIMLPQDASSMLPLCMAVYGSAHGSVRTLPCAQSSVRGSVRQYVALPHCPTLPNCHTTHTLPSALPHTAMRTAAHSHAHCRTGRTQVATRTAAHYCTLPHTTAAYCCIWTSCFDLRCSWGGWQTPGFAYVGHQRDARLRS